MSDALARDLAASAFRGDVRAAEPLAPLTTWRIGGPAEVLATPADREDVAAALDWARRRSVPWRVLGNGSNLLVRDEGVRGLVLRLRRVLDDVAFDDGRVTAGAGVSFPALANRCARRGLCGLEFAGGIPGTLGGALVMNAGWHEFETRRVVRHVDVLEADGSATRVDADGCRFGYRHSAFRERRVVILGAELRLTAGDADEIAARLEGYAASRKANQPTDLPSCGSVFLKPPGDYAGRLIEQAGLKGARSGGIEVSPKHANFFVNRGGGTAADVLRLVERVEGEVRQAFGVELVREFEVW